MKTSRATHVLGLALIATTAVPVAAAPIAAAPVTMSIAGRNAVRPPIVEVLLDMTLTNDRDEQRWFVLPAWIKDPAGTAGRDGVTGAESFALGGAGNHATLARFQGTGGFTAVLLAPRARVTLHRLALPTWDDEDAPASMREPLSFDVTIAKSILVGGEPAAAWLGASALSDRNVDASADAVTRSGARHTKDRGEVPVKFETDQVVHVEAQ
jgi:hypothetical protein